MADIARLGLEVDARQFVEAIRIQEEFVRKSGAVERANQSAGRSSKEAAESTTQRAQQETAANREIEAAAREAALAAEQRASAHEAAAQAATQRAQQEAQALQVIAQAEQGGVQQHQAALEERVAMERDAATERAMVTAQAMQEQFANDMVAIKEAQMRGFLTPAEARAQAQQVGQAYNEGILGTLDELRSATGSATPEGFDTLVGSLVNVDDAGQRASIGVGRLNTALGSLFRQVSGAHPIIGQLSSTIGTFAVGGVATAGALAGLAAISIAFRKLSEDSRRAKEDTEDARGALQRLQEQQRVASLGPGGLTAETAGVARAAAEQMAAEIVELEEWIAASQRHAVTESDRELAGIEQAMFQRRLQHLRADYADRMQEIGAGERDVAETQAREARNAERALFEVREQVRRENEASSRAFQSSAGVVTDLSVQIEEQERMAAAMRSGEEAVEAHGRAIAREAAIRQVLASDLLPQHRAAALALVDVLHDQIEANALLVVQIAKKTEAETEAKAAADALRDAYDDEATTLDRQANVLGRTIAARSQGSDAVRALRVELAAEEAVLRLGVDASEEMIAAVEERARVVALLGMELERLTEEERGAANTATELARSQEQAAALTQQAWIAAIGSIGQGLGGLAQQLAGIAQAGIAAGPGGAAVAAITVGAGMYFASGSGPSREDLDKATDDWARSLDRFVDTLSDRSRYEQVLREQEQAVGGMIEGMVESMFAQVHRYGKRRGVLGEAKETRERDRLEAALPILESQGIEAFAAEIKRTSTRLFTAFKDDFEALAEVAMEAAAWREREIASMNDSLEIREAVALGMDAEAEAMRLRISHAEELAEAVALGDDALEEFTKRVHALEVAAVAAAAAEKEAAEAARNVAIARDVGLDFDAREASLAGDDRGALVAQVTRRAEAEIARIDALRTEQLISEEEHVRYVGIAVAEAAREIQNFDDAAASLAESLRDSAHAAMEAARAEQMRQHQDMQSLEVRMLQAQGNDAGAHSLRQQMEMESALFEGRSSAYLLMLQQVQAEENRAAAMRVGTEATNEATRSIERMASAINAPRGFRMAALRHDMADPFGVGRSSPAFGGGQSVTNQSVEIGNISLPNVTNAREFVAELGQVVTELVRSGQPNPLTPQRR